MEGGWTQTNLDMFDEYKVEKHEALKTNNEGNKAVIFTFMQLFSDFQILFPYIETMIQLADQDILLHFLPGNYILFFILILFFHFRE